MPRKNPRRLRPRSRGYGMIHEDAHLLVVDKDPGILSVPIPDKHSANVQDLLNRYLEPTKQRALTVHRIDRYTSGLIVFAKNRRARERLVAQFRAHTPERFYLALMRGQPEDDEGVLEHRLELTLDGFRQQVVSKGGTLAVTHYRVLERMPAACLLEVQLDTGLKNQIRVQFAAAGMPLVGDRHYDPREAQDPLRRQALHAWRIGFAHPADGELVQFQAPIPVDFERAMERLRLGESGPAQLPASPPDGRPNRARSGRPRSRRR